MFKAGDIVRVDLNPTKGGEKSRVRPCLVIVGTGHPWGLLIIVPITEIKKSRSEKLFIQIPSSAKSGLTKSSAVDCFQIRCISEERIKEKIGLVPHSILNEVKTRLAMVLDIGEENVL